MGKEGLPLEKRSIPFSSTRACSQASGREEEVSP